MLRFWFLLCLFFTFAGSAGLVHAYSTRVPVTIANPSGGVLTNHTIRVELNAANVPGFDWSNNGDDILVTDATFNSLDYYIESFDAVGQQAVVWIEVPSIPVSPPDTTVYIYYDDATASPLSNAADTFATGGFKYHTQFYDDPGPGPANRAAGEAIFDFDSVAASGSGYGCTQLGSIEVDNSGTFGSNNDIGYFYETFFEVPVGETWEFRMGADFGHGGEVYVDGQTIEADWADDLWWAFNYNNNAEVLVGSIVLAPGTHTLKALGFERCCDGPSGIQFRRSGGPWQDFEVGTPNLTLYAPSCPITNNTFGPPESVPVTLAQFSSFKAGPFYRFDWQTVSETFNVGFRVWAKVDDQWQPLNKRLIRSRSKDTAEPQTYRFDFNNTRRQLQFDQLALSSVDVTGIEQFHGPFATGQSYGNEQLPEPIDWQAVQQSYAERMRQKGYQYIGYRWRKPLRNNPANTDKVLLEIPQKGVYRITYEELLQQGVDWTDVRKKWLSVSHQGQAVTRFIGGGNKFGPGSYIDFFADIPKGRDALYSGVSNYILEQNPELARKATKIKRKPETWDNAYLKTVHIEQQKFYNELSPLDDPWLMDELFAGNNPAAVIYKFAISDPIDSGGFARLSGRFAGVTDLPEEDIDNDGEIDDEHHIRLFINEREEPVYDGSFDGIVAWIAEAKFPANWLQAGENTLTVQLPADTGYRFDLVAVDALTIHYPVRAQGSVDTVVHTSSDSQNAGGIELPFADRSDLIAYAYQESHNLARLKVHRVNADSLVVPKIADGQAGYWISSAGELLKPSAIQRLAETEPLVTADVDLLIISHPVFINDSLQDYAAARSAQGVSSQIVSTDDIANRYGVDVPLPTAIQRFLAAADQRIKYDAVLLVGGHSYDYRQYQSAQAINFLPTFYRPIWLINYNPTDLPFVDFDNDGRPEKSIGRWPVRTQTDLQAIIDKSLAWETNRAERQQSGLQIALIADEQDRLDFSRALDSLSTQIEQASLPVAGFDKIYVDELKNDPSVPAGSIFQTATERLLESVENGADWLIYNGHASPTVWSFSSVLTTQSVADMNNPNQPVMVMPLACYTTYYESPTTNTLAHQLLFAGNKGAVAVHGAMMLGEYYGNLKMAETFMEVAEPDDRLGDVIKRAKQRLPVNYLNTAYNWALLGDPTLSFD